MAFTSVSQFDCYQHYKIQYKPGLVVYLQFDFKMMTNTFVALNILSTYSVRCRVMISGSHYGL